MRKFPLNGKRLPTCNAGKASAKWNVIGKRLFSLVPNWQHTSMRTTMILFSVSSFHFPTFNLLSRFAHSADFSTSIARTAKHGKTKSENFKNWWKERWARGKSSLQFRHFFNLRVDMKINFRVRNVALETSRTRWNKKILVKKQQLQMLVCLVPCSIVDEFGVRVLNWQTFNT